MSVAECYFVNGIYNESILINQLAVSSSVQMNLFSLIAIIDPQKCTISLIDIMIIVLADATAAVIREILKEGISSTAGTRSTVHFVIPSVFNKMMPQATTIR